MKDSGSHRVLFVGKKESRCCAVALGFVKAHFGQVFSCLGHPGEPMPEGMRAWLGDLIFDWDSPWTIPGYVADKAAHGAVRFGLGSAEYHGEGAASFALYEGAAEFGVVAYRVDPAGPPGQIIASRRFPIFASDGLNSLLTRAEGFRMALFYEVAGHILQHGVLPKSDKSWLRQPYSAEELDKLRCLTPDMPAEELEKRTRATSSERCPLRTTIAGRTFELGTEV